jgi:hypothetical protein
MPFMKSMRARKYTAWLLLLLLVPVYFISCEKNDVSSSPEDQTALAIAGVRAAFEQQQFSSMDPIRLHDTVSLAKTPVWTEAAFVKVSDTVSYLYVPIAFGVQSDSRRQVYLQRYPERLYVIARISDGKPVVSIGTYLSDSVGATDIHRFTGKLIMEDTHGRKRYAVYRHGIAQKPGTGTARTAVIVCTDQYACSWFRVCPDGSIEVTASDWSAGESSCGRPNESLGHCPGRLWTLSGQTVVGQFCELVPDPPPPPPPPPGGGTNPPPPPPPGGGTGGTGSASLDSIGVGEITTPCFIQSLNLALNKGLKNKVTSIFNSMFAGASGQVDVFFAESPNVPNGDYAHTNASTSGNFMNIDIVLNQNTLAHASQELIVATLYHEMLHAIFDANKMIHNDMLSWNETFQHQTMAAAYVGKMMAALQETFPGMSSDDAIALSWEGLQDTLAWQGFAGIAPAEANNILLRGDAYDENHTKGTRCP